MVYGNYSKKKVVTGIPTPLSLCCLLFFAIGIFFLKLLSFNTEIYVSNNLELIASAVTDAIEFSQVLHE